MRRYSVGSSRASRRVFAQKSRTSYQTIVRDLKLRGGGYL